MILLILIEPARLAIAGCGHVLNRAKRVGNVLVMGDERDGADNLSEKVTSSVKLRSASWFARRLTNLQHGSFSSPTTRVSMRYIATQNIKKK